MSRPDGQSSARPRAEAGLGKLALRRGEPEAAVILLSTALEDGLPDADAASAAQALGQAYVAVKRYADAFALFRRFLLKAKARGDRFEELRFRNRLAEAFLESGDVDLAREVITAALAAAREGLDSAQRPRSYWEQARNYARRGDETGAARYAELTVASLLDGAHAEEAERTLELLGRIEELDAATTSVASTERPTPS